MDRVRDRANSRPHTHTTRQNMVREYLNPDMKLKLKIWVPGYEHHASTQNKARRRESHAWKQDMTGASGLCHKTHEWHQTEVRGTLTSTLFSSTVIVHSWQMKHLDNAKVINRGWKMSVTGQLPTQTTSTENSTKPESMRNTWPAANEKDADWALTLCASGTKKTQAFTLKVLKNHFMVFCKHHQSHFTVYFDLCCSLNMLCYVGCKAWYWWLITVSNQEDKTPENVNT